MMRVAAIVLALAGLLACGGAGQEARGGGGGAEGADTSSMPEEVRTDYVVFARRCSKCHSLARPLNSGIDDDAYWAEYVRRMRLQPASGISHEDEATILRFLHWYSVEQRKRKSGETSAPPGSVAPVAPASEASPAAPSPASAADGGT
jgi:hypothetical protein